MHDLAVNQGLLAKEIPQAAQNALSYVPYPDTDQKRTRMAKPNYSFEKRQRELAKKKKKEEKRQQKLDAKAAAAPEGQPHPSGSGDQPE